MAWTYLKETMNEFQQDRTLRLAAATAYYAVFSLGPLLVLAVGLAGLVYGEERVSREVGRQLQSFVGAQSAQLIQSPGGGLIMAASAGPEGNIVRPPSPGERVQAQPWGFVGLALAAGIGTGLLLRYRGLRKALALYLAVRKVV